MRRIKFFMTMLVLAFLFVGMTSCERDDEDIACNLNGVWDGSIKSRDGVPYLATFYFNQHGYSNHGNGYEYDHNWMHSSVTRFQWYVENSCIYIEYEDEGNERIIMEYDGPMPYGNVGDCLYGYFLDYYTKSTLASFSLKKIDDNYNNYYEYY